MPIYEYVCSTCGHRTDILHGIDDPTPEFCPSCGAEGSLRKAFAPPMIVFKGSGWAKKDRSVGRSKPPADGAEASGDAAPISPRAEGASTSQAGSDRAPGPTKAGSTAGSGGSDGSGGASGAGGSGGSGEARGSRRSGRDGAGGAAKPDRAAD